LEFRCFVNGKRITAISQYDPLGYFPHVANHQEEIQSTIFNFYKEFVQYQTITKKKKERSYLMF
jgi:D123